MITNDSKFRREKAMARPKGLQKIKICLSLDTETKDRLYQIAQQKHLPVNAVITQWIWEETVKGESDE